VTPDQISKLPPELQPAAEIKRSLRPEQRARWERRLAEGMEETDDFPACTPDQRAILWTLMELKSAEQALESSLTWGLQMQEANAKSSELMTAMGNTIATLMREAADDALHNKFRDEVFDKYEKQVATLTRERDAAREELTVHKVFAENVHKLQRERMETAEAEVVRLRGDAEKWQKFSEAIKGVWDAALSHTHEGRTK
jgi:hypothetical protein